MSEVPRVYISHADLGCGARPVQRGQWRWRLCPVSWLVVQKFKKGSTLLLRNLPMAFAIQIFHYGIMPYHPAKRLKV